MIRRFPCFVDQWPERFSVLFDPRATGDGFRPLLGFPQDRFLIDPGQLAIRHDQDAVDHDRIHRPARAGENQVGNRIVEGHPFRFQGVYQNQVCLFARFQTAAKGVLSIRTV